MPPPSNGKGRKLDRFDPAERSKRVGKTKEELLADLRLLKDVQSDATFTSSKRDRL